MGGMDAWQAFGVLVAVATVVDVAAWWLISRWLS